MAKSSIQDQIRPFLAIFLKYYFWMLAAVVPLILLPLLFLARGSMKAQIDSVRQQIDSHIGALQNIRSTADHPNESWSKGIEEKTTEINKETLQEWQNFWESQKALRVWPEESLGPDFVKTAESLKPDGKLSPKFRERYQNTVRALVRNLPVRMGVEDKMGDLTEEAQSRPTPRRPVRQQPAMRPGVEMDDSQDQSSPYMMEWSPENQQRIYASFNWDKAPTPAKVLLAQEELWVYQVFCDILAGMNKPATGPHNTAIARVDELSVGYPAAEDDPGGVSGKRVFRVAGGGQGAGSDDMGGAPPGAGLGPLVRPPNVRFGGSASFASAAAAAPTYSGDDEPPQPVAAADPDETLRNWIYVDFTGKPLTGAEVAAAPDSQMVHLMPFVMRLVIDQRQIDALLASLSTAAVPIDVRQVRINASNAAADQPFGQFAGVEAAGGQTGSGRIYDVNLELRGTIGLATPPSATAVGLESGGSGEQPVAAPSAARALPAALRRTAS